MLPCPANVSSRCCMQTSGRLAIVRLLLSALYTAHSGGAGPRCDFNLYLGERRMTQGTIEPTVGFSDDGWLQQWLWVDGQLVAWGEATMPLTQTTWAGLST